MGNSYVIATSGINIRNARGHAPVCSRSKETSNGDPYVFRTSIENKHQLVLSSISR